MALAVFDASALIALLRGEPGWEIVAPLRRDSLISSVNAAEVAQILIRLGADGSTARSLIARSGVEIVSFDADLAFEAAALEKQTRKVGLSLGDRACLALAVREELPAYTADRAWRRVESPADIRLIR